MDFDMMSKRGQSETDLTSNSEESFCREFEDTETDCDFLSDDEEKPPKLPKSSTKISKQKIKKLQKCDKKRAQSQSVNYLKMPIQESEDENDNVLPHNLGIPKLHNRAFSESSIIHKQIQENQWPSTASSDESFDAESAASSNNVYSRYVEMKKKYKKQRRISKQFQSAITVIQDDNEDNLNENERRLRSQFAKEYEIKLMELESEKLNNAMHIESKYQRILSQNDDLKQQNNALQQQIASQIAMMQHQQQMVFTQRSMASSVGGGDSMYSPSIASPLSTVPHFAFNPNVVKRLSCDSSVIGMVNHQNYSTPDSDRYILNGDNMSVQSTNHSVSSSWTVDGGDLSLKHSAFNMEPPKNKKNKKRKRKKRKNSKIHAMEARLLQNDDEVLKKIGDGQSSWDRFLSLMTPSFCSCSPAQLPPKTLL